MSSAGPATSGRTVLLFGGTSSERRVSVATAQHFLALFDELVPWFIDPQGGVHPCDAATVTAHPRPFEDDLVLGSSARWPGIEAALDALAGQKPMFLLGLHGGDGENGVLQGQLERRALVFTGSGSVASARAFDKVKAKALVRRGGVPTAPSIVIPAGSGAGTRALLQRFWEEHGRCVLKPVADGSSVGLYHLTNAGGLDAIADTVGATKQDYLVETFVEGRELTIGVVEDSMGLRALPISEVRVEKDRAFDYAGKYLGKGTIEVTPAELPAPIADQAKVLAVAAHAIVGCRGYSRTDVILNPQGLVFLEINTLPGLTRMSFVPQQLAAEGTSMERFVRDQLTLAARRA